MKCCIRLLILSVFICSCLAMNFFNFVKQHEIPAHDTSDIAAIKGGGTTDTSLKPFIEKVIEGKHLTSIEAEEAWDIMLKGADSNQIAALLVLLRMKGEKASEIAGMVRAMRSACLPVSIPGKLLDIVGTGGDGAHTINISTAAAILAAACGAKVAKFGNRSVSSKSGSADVLEALGIKITMSPEQITECVEKCGVSFMFAPIHHPSMKAVVPTRRALGVRTVFNILGPMTNPAGAQRVVIGVFQKDLMKLMADTLKEVGYIDHAVVIHGCGLDEISPMGPSKIVEVKNVAAPGKPKRYRTRTMTFDPKSLGIPRCTVEDLKGGEARENAAEMRAVLAGGDHTNAKRDAVVLNAGVGLYVYGLEPSIKRGVERAYEVLKSGKALEQLNLWISTSKSIS
mmetsp:Transcript_5508/g.7575  ORF Transcript_5508/g.7575 Transcript_5508/m.7575 type:complete len:398 (+) Transcript_5508:52-1245(+)